MPNLVNWEQCCGCGACFNKCSKHAISMQPNHEGFLHPVIDTDKCVECGACELVCPGLNPTYNEDAYKNTFVVQHKDDIIRYQSTSGGAFTAIAEEIIKRNGIVFGAVMTNNLKVIHDSAETFEELFKFRNSKYVQSEIGDSYCKVKSFLKDGRWVCFSGTPCQINGLIKYLGKDYDRLITVDVVCKSVPSPLIFKKYVDYKRSKEGELSDIVFRDKKRGFLYCTMAHYLTHDDRLRKKDVYRRGSESDEWLRLFLSGKISRRSCMTCPYQTAYRIGDFTLGDIWETGDSNFDDNKGSTLVHVWSKKGINFLDDLKEYIRIVEYPYDSSRGAERKNIIQLYPKRNELFTDVLNLSENAFFARYAPNGINIQMKRVGRYLIWRLHLHNIVRHFKHLVIHRNK